MLEWTDLDVDGLLVRRARDPAVVQERGCVVLVPGSLHGWWAFERWMPVFARAGWTPLSMSFPNHTGSRTVATGEYLSLTPADYAADLLAVLDRAGPGTALLGHSMGGLVAQLAAQQSPPSALVLVSAVGPGQLGAMRAAPYPIDRPVMVSRDQAREQWFHHLPEAALDTVMGRLRPESPAVVNAYSDGSIHIDTGSITCPVLVVGPENDRSPVHDVRRIAELYGVTPVLVPGVGHDMMLEDAGQHTACAIAEWLNGYAE
ncbi:alpha/beta hydrolase [Streptacidiphilus sp. PB12-B1b]|uniref:alpha/beta hydrolase n=1 Tax=Streptacidiphilus sp. PB12-B1b TaxID=2705012 RepID=UPI0015FDC98A|nr:alpha/beta fold hydrolase [Streptacidiphilus sp. PB12-B1b]QMU76968.1 alpha/beta hydrolase [Streptacidiphilus sp. PB12-B1b]